VFLLTEKQVEKTFEAMFALEELREIWRLTKPDHKLTKEQKEQVKEILEKVRKALDEIEKG